LPPPDQSFNGIFKPRLEKIRKLIMAAIFFTQHLLKHWLVLLAYQNNYNASCDNTRAMTEDSCTIAGGLVPSDISGE
jgi:hypothetical protein